MVVTATAHREPKEVSTVGKDTATKGGREGGREGEGETEGGSEGGIETLQLKNIIRYILLTSRVFPSLEWVVSLEEVRISMSVPFLIGQHALTDQLGGGWEHTD